MKKNMWFVLPLALVLAAYGCGKKADSNKPIDEVRVEAQKMDQAQLEKQAQAYAKEISKKTSDMQEVQNKLKGLSPQELFGDKAKDIKDQASKIATEVSALTERYNVYAEQFQKAGGDLSKIKLA
ncbi:MAG TPA: hypothetical protein VL688_03945 [Verrucomicrobiae bacterium]|jgi:peptidoglycan hydrolase CwlO-like protein|nr:hypothetical protein [Verrucomicrobiae bacterium]